MLTFKELLLNLLKFLQEERVPTLKTRLIKLAYLCEVEYVRSFKERISNSPWVYYKYGPYVFDYDKILQDKDFTINPDDDDDFSRIALNDMTSLPKLEFHQRIIIQRIVKKYGREDLLQLLDHVYFNTEPMMYVNNPKDELNFSFVLPKSEYSDTSQLINAKSLSSVIEYVKSKKKHVRKL